MRDASPAESPLGGESEAGGRESRGAIARLDALALACLAIAFAAGPLLMFHYEAGLPQAHESVRRLSEEVPFGALLRGIHRLGAQAAAAHPLPGEADGWWGTVVGLGVARRVPGGSIAAAILQGGPSLSGGSLRRFLAAHAAVLPWPLAAAGGPPREARGRDWRDARGGDPIQRPEDRRDRDLPRRDRAGRGARGGNTGLLSTVAVWTWIRDDLPPRRA